MLRRSKRLESRAKPLTEKEATVRLFLDMPPRKKRTRKEVSPPSEEDSPPRKEVSPPPTDEDSPPRKEVPSDEDASPRPNAVSPPRDEVPVAAESSVLPSGFELAVVEGNVAQDVQEDNNKKGKGKGKKKDKGDDGEDFKCYEIPERLERITVQKLIDSHRLHPGRPPDIPIHRMFNHEKVRKVCGGESLEHLVESMESHNWMGLNSIFTVTVGPPFDASNLTPEEQESDRAWLEELDAPHNAMWKEDLHDKSFLIWDGNHRKKAIEIVQKKRPGWIGALRVTTTVIRISAEEEIDFIRAFEELNIGMQKAVRRTLIHMLCAIRNSCTSEPATMELLKRLTPADQKRVHAWKEKNRDVWYPFMPEIIVKAIFPVLVQTEVAEAMQSKKEGVSTEQVLNTVYTKNGKLLRRLLNIVNPAHGEHWWEVVSTIHLTLATKHITGETEHHRIGTGSWRKENFPLENFLRQKQFTDRISLRLEDKKSLVSNQVINRDNPMIIHKIILDKLEISDQSKINTSTNQHPTSCLTPVHQHEDFVGYKKSGKIMKREPQFESHL